MYRSALLLSVPVLLAVPVVAQQPSGNATAQKLIDSSGLRGKRVNGAEISAKSSNLIINRGEATPNDIVALMEMTRDRVRSRFGVTLQPEIRMLGFADGVDLVEEPLELAALA